MHFPHTHACPRWTRARDLPVKFASTSVRHSNSHELVTTFRRQKNSCLWVLVSCKNVTQRQNINNKTHLALSHKGKVFGGEARRATKTAWSQNLCFKQKNTRTWQTFPVCDFFLHPIHPTCQNTQKKRKIPICNPRGTKFPQSLPNIPCRT